MCVKQLEKIILYFTSKNEYTSYLNVLDYSFSFLNAQSRDEMVIILLYFKCHSTVLKSRIEVLFLCELMSSFKRQHTYALSLEINHFERLRRSRFSFLGHYVKCHFTSHQIVLVKLISLLFQRSYMCSFGHNVTFQCQS